MGPRTKPVWNASKALCGGRPEATNTDDLTPPSKIWVEPSKSWPSDDNGALKMVKKYVECSAKI